MKNHLSRPAGWALLALGLLLPAGCGPSRPAGADPEKGKAALRATLDAWMRGQTPDSLRSLSPAIHANDPAWSAGARLEKYEILEQEGRHNGYDFNCPVTLWLTGGGGTARQQTVRYAIGTSPALVVLRDMGP